MNRHISGGVVAGAGKVPRSPPPTPHPRMTLYSSDRPSPAALSAVGAVPAGRDAMIWS
jgi:hypothetical protein